MEPSKLFMMLPRDIALYLSEYLSIDDASNMYKAGRYLKLFVDKFYIKDGYLTIFNIKGRDKIKYFSSFMEFLATNLSEVNFCFSKTGLTIFEIDQSSFTKTKLILRKSFFDIMFFPFQTTRGINLKNFARLVKTNNDMSSMSVGIKKHNSSELAIIYKDSEKIVWSYKLKTLELNRKEINLPALYIFDLIIKIDNNLWTSIVSKFIKSGVDNVNIEFCDNTLKFYGRNDINGIEQRFENLDKLHKFIQIYKKSDMTPMVLKGKFNFRFLLGYKKVYGNNHLNVCFKNDFPLIVYDETTNYKLMFSFVPIKN